MLPSCCAQVWSLCARSAEGGARGRRVAAEGLLWKGRESAHGFLLEGLSLCTHAVAPTHSHRQPHHTPVHFSHSLSLPTAAPCAAAPPCCSYQAPHAQRPRSAHCQGAAHWPESGWHAWPAACSPESPALALQSCLHCPLPPLLLLSAGCPAALPCWAAHEWHPCQSHWR